MTRYKRQDPELTRRRFINVAMGTTAAVGGVSLLSVLGSANPVFRLTRDKMPPLRGDILVHASNNKEGQPILISEVGEQLVRAWPQGRDENGQPIIRKGDPNNLVALYRFPRGQFADPTNLEATINQEVVAYSDICTHAGCTVTDSDTRAGAMKCPCHSGEYDPKRGAIVVGGPPPRKLAQLPITQQGENIVVTGFFLSNPYGYSSEEEWESFTREVEEQLA